MSRNRQPPPVEKCTFCGKSRHMVESLIAGPPHIYICNECVELCNSILIEELHKGEPPASDAGEIGRGGDFTKLNNFVCKTSQAKAVVDRFVGTLASYAGWAKR